MAHRTKTINEAILSTSLNELAHSLVRELAMAARKVSIYGASHPMATRSLEKPFLTFDKIFKFKRYVTFNILMGELYVINICLKESVFCRDIVRFMQTLEVDAMLFKRRLTMSELTSFVGRFVRRVNLSDRRHLLGHYLDENKIDTIEVNSERAFRMFEKNKQYRGDVHGDFSVKSLVLRQMGDDLRLLAAIDRSGEQALDEHGIDYDSDIVAYLLPEKIASIAPDDFCTWLADLARQAADEDDPKKQQGLVDTYRAVYKLLDYHNDQGKIIEDLQKKQDAISLLPELAKQIATSAGVIKLEAEEQIDDLLKQLLLPQCERYDVDEFHGAFLRLLRTGQRGKAIDVISSLIDQLEVSHADIRQKALNLLVCAVQPIDPDTDRLVFEKAVERVVSRLNERKETFEYSELIWRLVEKCISTSRFDLMARLTKAMAKRRKIVDSVTIYDSMAVKQALGNVNRPTLINALVDELIRADHETTSHIREILIAVGSEEVALALSNIISHPTRHVRQQALKVLAELGKASLKVFSQILENEVMFEREPGRHELPDSKWYIVRNSIFVLGSLEDPEGVVPLRLRINDHDVRVRREIVSTLEKIGGEEACDLLILMADDPDREIRESAVIAAGLVGTPETAPLVIDVARRNPSLATRSVYALGNLGGEEARNYLVRILTEENELSQLASGQVSKDDLRLAVVKALGKIGDKDSIDRIKEFRKNLSAAQKILFKNSSVNKAISEILARH